MRNQVMRRFCLLALAVAAVTFTGFTARARAQAASLDQILKEISTYDGGIESQALWKLRDYVQARKDDLKARAECEPKLIAFLGTDATMAAKAAVGRALRVVATERAVPLLQPLLADQAVFDYALYGLQQIPGAATDKALMQALAQSAMPIAAKTSLVAALGERRSALAVPALVPLLKQAELAKAAATALGAIGGDAAAQALVVAYPGAQDDLRPTLAASLLKCAERRLASKDAPGALRFYETLAADASLPVPFKRSAALGRLAASGSKSTSVLMGYLQGSDPVLQEAAIARLRAVVDKDDLGPVCKLLPRLPEASQIQLLAALASYSTDRVVPSLLDSARSQSENVRIAAWKALGATGGADEVPVLVQAAASTRGAEQAAARAALGALEGHKVDAAIVSYMRLSSSDTVIGELLTAISDRRIYSAKPEVAAFLSSTSAQIRLGALRSLRIIGTPSDMGAVLDVIGTSRDETERTEAGRTIVALAQKIANVDGRSGAIRGRITGVKDATLQARYIGLLPLVGDNAALPVLRRALESPDAGLYDAAARALATWPTPAAREDVLQLARDSKNETHRLLALTGFIRIVRLDRYRNPKAAVADLRQAADLASRPEERRLILGALGEFPCREALEMARSFANDPTLAAEVAATVKRLEAALKAKT